VGLQKDIQPYRHAVAYLPKLFSKCWKEEGSTVQNIVEKRLFRGKHLLKKCLLLCTRLKRKKIVLCLRSGQSLKNDGQLCRPSLTASTFFATYSGGEGGLLKCKKERKSSCGKRTAVYSLLVGFTTSQRFLNN
jgi:hypothetical protein